jgi:hypothetical protein
MGSVKFWKVYASKNLAKINFEAILLVANHLGYRIYKNQSTSEIIIISTMN